MYSVPVRREQVVDVTRKFGICGHLSRNLHYSAYNWVNILIPFLRSGNSQRTSRLKTPKNGPKNDLFYTVLRFFEKYKKRDISYLHQFIVEHCCPNGTWDDGEGSCGEHCVELDGTIVRFFPEPLLNCWNKFCEKGGQFAIRRDSELTVEF